MPLPVFAAAGEAVLENSTYALAIAALGAMVREVIGWLRDRDAKRHDTEKALLAAEVKSLKDDVAELKAGLSAANARLQECQDDRAELHEKFAALAGRLEASDDRERTRHPDDPSIPPVAPRK